MRVYKNKNKMCIKIFFLFIYPVDKWVRLFGCQGFSGRAVPVLGGCLLKGPSIC